MNDRLHFGIKPRAEGVSLSYHWASLGEQAGPDEPATVTKELLIDLPPNVRDYLPEGSLRLMFDSWS